MDRRVTPTELFFDLVFVFAFTQVTTLLVDDPKASVRGFTLAQGERCCPIIGCCPSPS